MYNYKFVCLNIYFQLNIVSISIQWEWKINSFQCQFGFSMEDWTMNVMIIYILFFLLSPRDDLNHESVSHCSIQGDKLICLILWSWLKHCRYIFYWNLWWITITSGMMMKRRFINNYIKLNSIKSQKRPLTVC